MANQKTKIAIIVIVIIAFLFILQTRQQNFAERQEEIRRQDNQRDKQTKIEQDNKNYIAERKDKCFEIYQKEKNAINNVVGYEYYADQDSCVVKYYNEKLWEGKDCNKLLPDSGLSSTSNRLWLRVYNNCTEKVSVKEF